MHIDIGTRDQPTLHIPGYKKLLVYVPYMLHSTLQMPGCGWCGHSSLQSQYRDIHLKVFTVMYLYVGVACGWLLWSIQRVL